MDLFVVIKDRENTIFQDKVKAVTSFNEIGVFDVLPQHAHFISLIKDNIILHKDNGREEIKIEGGVMKVFEDKVEIYIGVFPHP